ncbi:hypothetical protein CDL12_08682 [Handroanthus impetiginosus]|uniref:Uncharacterized protein n=1 Tax=Handroanthus impetiginosus TaxID=429701 RepID=A0A2G9HM94_9LAMI|nr:hypothetical protein CDL12_08682 [Handroanthus impetiginosus]
MNEERKDDKDEEEEEKIEEDKTKEGQDDKKSEKEDGEDEEKECEKEEERKDGDDDEERDHDADNEYNDMNEENQTKHRAGQVSCYHKVEMNKKHESISRKLDFGQQVGERDYEVNRDELIKKQKLKNFDSSMSTTPAKRAKHRNEESDHGKEKKTIPEQEKAGPKKKKVKALQMCFGIDLSTRVTINKARGTFLSGLLATGLTSLGHV